MKSSDIRTMSDNEALFITSNKLPAKLKIKPYYNDFIFKNYAKLPPFKINVSNHLNEVKYIELENN
jgi:hypothetical protein